MTPSAPAWLKKRQVSFFLPLPLCKAGARVSKLGGQHHIQRGCGAIKTGERGTDPDYQGIQGYIASPAGKKHTSVLCIGIWGNKAQRDLRDWSKPSCWGWGRSGCEVQQESATIRKSGLRSPAAGLAPLAAGGLFAMRKESKAAPALHRRCPLHRMCARRSDGICALRLSSRCLCRRTHLPQSWMSQQRTCTAAWRISFQTLLSMARSITEIWDS